MTTHARTGGYDLFISYARKDRAVGEPKQSFSKLFRYALDGLFSFSDLPLQWIAATGAVALSTRRIFEPMASSLRTTRSTAELPARNYKTELSLKDLKIK